MLCVGYICMYICMRMYPFYFTTLFAHYTLLYRYAKVRQEKKRSWYVLIISIIDLFVTIIIVVITVIFVGIL